jgi:alpha-L-fucosidase
MFLHFGPNTWQDKEYDDRSTPLSSINPAIDTDQWVDTAVGLGAKYVILVAKHAGGFCNWQTATTDYSIKSTTWHGGRGDVMADLSASCARRGILLGVYLSPRDDSQGARDAGRCADADRQAAYDVLYRQQLTELLTRYGPIVELWLDGSSVVPTGDLVHRYAPDAMVFQGPQATIRWVGNEDGFAPYPAWNALARADAATGIATALHGDPGGDAWMPLEVDVSIRRPRWFWSPTNGANLLTAELLLEIHYRSVGRGAQLLLNVPPDDTGHIAAADARVARAFGDEVRRRFGTAVAETSGAVDADAGFATAHLPRTLTLQLPGGPRRLDHVVLEEDLAGGERVREYRLEGLVNGAWTLLGTGTAIGHKRIHPVGPVTAAAIRLACARVAAPPMIRRFAAFDTGAAPPASWQQQAQLWADDAAGSWTDGRCDADLTAKFPAAAQYRVRFVAAGGERMTLTDVELLVGGVRQPHLVRRATGRANVLVLTVPGLGERIVLRARVRGAARGTLLVQRL